MKRVFLVSAAWACLQPWGTAELRAQDAEPIRIGVVDSLLRDLSPGRRKLMDTEFPDLVREFTGIKSEISQGGDPFTAAKKLADGKWHLAVLQGVEFAWAQEQDEKLQPLMLFINRDPTLHALLVTKKDSPIAGFADLKGKTLQVLEGREHCRLFVEKSAGGEPSKFFGKVTATGNSEGALDAILLSKADAAVVDGATFETYKDIQPGRHARLKVLAKSEAFPPTALAYRQGGLSDAVLDNFKSGMLKANQSERGREAMGNMRITAFEPVSQDYARLLREIAKTYPAPVK